MSVLGFACVLLPYSCSALHSYTRKQISFPAPPRSTGLHLAIAAPLCGAVLRGGGSKTEHTIQFEAEFVLDDVVCWDVLVRDFQLEAPVAGEVVARSGNGADAE